MKTAYFAYLKNLINILSKIEVTTRGNIKLEFNEGIRQAIGLIKRQSRGGFKIIFIGNGGSASIASHQAVDYWKNGGMKAIAFNDASLITCISNDFGYEHLFQKPIEMFAEKGDIIIAISSSGKSKNILNAVDAAKENECSIITMSGFGPNNPLRFKGQINFYIPADSYGYVEIAHLTICHCILDSISRCL